MAKSLAQIEKQIETLKQQAEEIRKKELSGVVNRIREAIEHYRITPEELFGSKAAARKSAAAGAKKTRKKAAKSARKTVSAAKYTDGAGHTWTGRGKRPNWFKAGLAAGKTAADMEIRA